MTEAELRTLDAKIHEKVMGLRIYFSAVSFEHPEVGNDYFDAASHVPVPHYSADIAAAWMVVAKMRSVNPERLIEVCEYTDKHGKPQSLCKIHEQDRFASCDDDAFQLGFAYAETPPLAICLAALNAHQKGWKAT